MASWMPDGEDRESSNSSIQCEARGSGRGSARKVAAGIFPLSGLLRVGAVYLPLNPAYQPAEIEYFTATRSPFFLSGI